MPDFLTHLLFGISLAIIWKPQTREEGILIVLGSVIIDIERPFHLFFTKYLGLYWLSLTEAFHSILGGLCLTFAISSCFILEDTDFWSRFKLIGGGCVLHLLLDLTMYKWEELGLLPFYPLRIPFSFHLVWPGYFWVPLGVFALLLALCYWCISRNAQRLKKQIKDIKNESNK